MSFWSRFFQRKESQARTILAIQDAGRPQPTPKNYEAFSKEGYQANVIAYKCVSLISRSAAAISWMAKSGEDELSEHPILDLLYKPNPMQGWSTFMESVVAYYMISGNSYVEQNKPFENQPPLELWSIRPDMMKVIPGAKGMPAGYIFRAKSGEISFPVDQLKGTSNILHLRTFHPTNNWYGLSPIEAAMYSIDQHNEAAKWNLGLLMNDGKPSGAVAIKMDASNPTGDLTDMQYARLKEQVEGNIAGSKNAGRILILEGGMDWKQMSFTPHDMDWMEGRKMAARDIALAFGVPPILLNIPGDSTFNNYREARLSFYEDTVIPLMDLFRDELNKWLTPQFGDESLMLDYDVDSIDAIVEKRNEKFSQLSTVNFLTTNEKRLAVGYDPLDGGDILLVEPNKVPINYLTEVEEPEEEINEETEPQENEQDQGEEQEPSEEQDSDGQNEDEEKGVDYELHEYKQINVFSKSGRVKAWREINKRRRILEETFFVDMKEELEQQAKNIADEVRKSEPRLAEFAALKGVEKSIPALKDIYRRNIKRAIKMFGVQILSSGKSAPEAKNLQYFNQFVERFVEQRTAEGVSLIEGTSIKRAKRIIKNVVLEAQEEGLTIQEAADQIQNDLVTLSDSRARTIARTEIQISSNQGAAEAIKALDIPGMKKEWVSVQDDRTRDGDPPTEANHFDMNGVKVGIDEKFTVPPDATMDGPGDPSAEAGQIINCRCVLVFERGE